MILVDDTVYDAIVPNTTSASAVWPRTSRYHDVHATSFVGHRVISKLLLP